MDDSLFIYGGRVIDPSQGLDAHAALLCKGGRVTDMLRDLSPEDTEAMARSDNKSKICENTAQPRRRPSLENAKTSAR